MSIWNMDIVTAVITPVVQSLLVPIKKHLGFLVSSSDKAREMHSKVAELQGALHDMQTQRLSAETSRRVVPHRVPDWLAEVEKLIEGRAGRIPAGGVGCFNLKKRYKVGKDSYDILKDINLLMKEKAEMVWPKEIVPLSAVPPATQEEDQNQSRFESRYILLNNALKILESPDISSQKMALCGMGGIGKTTMMEEMKNVASNRHMFDHIVKVVVGEKPNLAVIQQAVEEQTRTGKASVLTIEDNKAEQLKNRFKKMSEEGKKKILVILDDVWQDFDLKHIGLTSPLPVGFKLLLTSREESVCLQMGVQSSFIFKVETLTYSEGKKLFWETTGGDSHSELVKKIGEDIVMRCGGLPIAIKTIASTLIDAKEKHKWEDALFRIQNQDLRDRDNRLLIEIFKFSYENLQDDVIKDIFLLAGLYPEDYDINIEELGRYGWGLQFFKTLPNIAQARIRVKSCVDDLIRSNLLNKSERDGCVRMHDLVRDFVLISCSQVKQASIWNDANEVSMQLRGENSYDRILLDCEGLLEFPEDFNHPNLKLLKLMYGDGRLKFSEDFYARMKKLEVLDYHGMGQPKLPQFLTNLRALCLTSCSLEDVSIYFLGDLINLEILTLASCGIRKLPSKIGNLKKLKLLDLSGCNKLCIDVGVFQNLGKLEELYMGGTGIRFMDANCKPLKMLKLFALEFQFFKNEVRPVDVSFDKIKRFRISMGCKLKTYTSDEYSFRNTLMLVTSIDELLECKVNELFQKTEKLYLEVKDMFHLERILAPSPQNSFCMLKELCISGCKSLTYLFTVSMVEGLTELEILEVKSCPVLNTFIKGGDRDARVITFHKLKILVMKDLPELESMCDFVHVMKLPQLTELELDTLANITSIFPWINNNSSAKQTLLKNEAAIPNLEVLSVRNMKNLKEIWACEITSIEEEVNNTFMLKKLEVFNCENLEVLLTVYVTKRLMKLEILVVGSCPVLKSIVSGETNTEVCLRKLESLKFMSLAKLPKLVSLSDCVNTMELRMLKELKVSQLSNIVSIFPEIVTPKLEMLTIKTMENLQEIWSFEIISGEEEEVNTRSMLKEIRVSHCNSLLNLFPRNPMRLLSNLKELTVESCGFVEVLFNIDLGKTEQLCLNSSLKIIYVDSCESFKEVCRIKDVESNYSDLLMLISVFQSVEDLKIINCKRFTKIMVNSDLRATKNVNAYSERKIGMVLKKKQEQEITVSGEEILKVGDSMLIFAFPSYHITPSFNHLRRIKFDGVQGAKVMFEVESSTNNDQQQPLQLLPYLEEIKLYNMDMLSHVWKCNYWNEFLILHKTSFQNLTTIYIDHCKSVKYLFSPLMVTLFSNLTKVQISSCDGMEQVVSNRDDEDAEITTPTFAHTTTALFPSLQILELYYMSNLKQIGGGVGKGSANAACHGQSKLSPKDVASWSLCQYTKEIKILQCDALSSVVPSYAVGHMQKLQVMNIKDCSLMTEVFETEESYNNSISTILGIPRRTINTVHQLPNLKELVIIRCDLLKYVFTFSMLESLKKLETLTIKNCKAMKAIVREEYGDDTMTSSKEVVFPNLKSIRLKGLTNVEGFFLGMNIDFRWPMLEDLEIKYCPQLMVFTSGWLMAPRLKFIHTELGKHNIEGHFNSQTPSPNIEGIRSRPASEDKKPWSFHNLIECNVVYHHGFQKLFPSNELQHLQELETIDACVCNNVEEVFEVATERTNDKQQTVIKIPNLRKVELKELRSLKYIWKSNQSRMLEFPNLTTLSISDCESLEHVFTCSVVSYVKQLQYLCISDCKNMKVIVKKEEEEDCDAKVREIKFPCLKSLTLEYLPSLGGFCLGKEEFTFESLDTLVIEDCPKISVFTEGPSVTPKLNLIYTSFGSFNVVGEDVNAFIMKKKQEGHSFGELEASFCEQDEPSSEDD